MPSYFVPPVSLAIPTQQNHHSASNQRLLRDESPKTTVVTVISIIPHHKVMAWRHNQVIKILIAWSTITISRSSKASIDEMVAAC
jgi:hypothetical protein